jgi:hypothetical protein
LIDANFVEIRIVDAQGYVKMKNIRVKNKNASKLKQISEKRKKVFREEFLKENFCRIL